METEELSAENIITEKTKNAFLKKIDSVKKELRIAIESHKNADTDGLGIMRSLQYFLLQRGINADIFGSVSHSHPQSKTMVNKLQIDLKSREFFEENKADYGLVISCDTASAEKAFLKDVHPDIIIDHHKEGGVIKNCLVIRKKMGAASTIVYSLLKDIGMELPPEIATALALGIFVDTDSLLRIPPETEEIEVCAYDELRRIGNSVLFSKIVKYEKPRSLIELKRVAYNSVDYIGYVAIIGLGETKASQEHHYGDIADEFLDVAGIKLVIVIGVEEGQKIKASTRITGDFDSVQINEFCEKIFEAGSVTDTGEEASAGSNPTAGGANIPLSTREREEWEVADENEKKVLFQIKMKRYKERIKKELDLS
ncbi:DHH family phosphoesterase [Patescibacteria group bacterium]|nr:DHH family phosphoesterase [Patescibacteria group bacterium]